MAQRPPKASPTDAVAFLSRWTKEGPWVLTAIDLAQKVILAETFRPGEESAMALWIEDKNRAHNVYFQVNPVLRDVRKKTSRTDIASLAWLHVDIDPRPKRQFEAERRRALKMLQEPPGNVPPASAIIDSGGGLQGFWRLEEPVPIEGELERAEEAKLYNLSLEVVFGGDKCHNVDRVMRLPGTVNLPTKRKEKLGRRPRLATVVEYHDDRVYPLSAFSKAPPIQKDGPLPEVARLAISGNVPRYSSVHEIPGDVPDHLKVWIAQGCDPDEPNRWDSRSEAQWAVTCEMVRRKIDDEAIYSVLTDPTFRISSHVLDQHRPHEYALDQIARAHEHAVNPVLAELNAKHAVVGDIGGRCRVVSEDWDPTLDRPTMSFQTFADFRNRYCHRKVTWEDPSTGETKTARAGDWWLKNAMRRDYNRIIFAPGKEVPNSYNLWRGFNCEAIPGDGHLPFLEHVRENVCGGVEEHYDYLLGWMARTVQRPDTQGHSAVVLRGEQGTGKSFFAACFGRLFGHHYFAVSDSKHLVGPFNIHLRDAVVVFGDEAFYAGDAKHASVLKMLVTEDTLPVEAKFVDVIQAPNCVHLIMASNSPHVVPAGVNERRFFVLEVGTARQNDTRYFSRVKRAMEEKGGNEALLYMLLHHDLSKFDVRVVPKTDALREQKFLSLSPEQEWWFTKLREGRVFPQHERWEREVLVEEVVMDFIETTGRSWSSRRGNATALGMFLKRALPADFPRRRRLMKTTISLPDYRGRERRIVDPAVYVLPSLKACREHWDLYSVRPDEWPEPGENGDMPNYEPGDLPF